MCRGTSDLELNSGVSFTERLIFNPCQAFWVFLARFFFYLSGLSIETGMAFKMQQDMKIKTGISCDIEVKNSDVIFSLALGNFPDECFYQIHSMTSEDSGKETGSQDNSSNQLFI